MKYVFVPDERYEKPFGMKMDNGFLIKVPNPEPEEFEGPIRKVNFEGYHPLTFTFAEDGLLVSQEAYGLHTTAHVPGTVFCFDGGRIGSTVTAPKTRECFKMLSAKGTGKAYLFEVDGEMVANVFYA